VGAVIASDTAFVLGGLALVGVRLALELIDEKRFAGGMVYVRYRTAGSGANPPVRRP
jgi:hypothetical protein